MRSFVKYISYSFVFLVIMIASAFGAITLSMNNSANQMSNNDNVTDTIELPKQITSIVENLTSSNAVELNLSATIDNIENDDYFINLSTTVDLSNGFENIAVMGTLNLQNFNLNEINVQSSSDAQKNYEINFVYKNEKVYLDMLEGKISFETNNIIEPITQIISLLGVDMPDLGEFNLGDLDINMILSMLSDLKEIKNEDGTLTLDINIEMLNTSIQLICDKSYNVLEIVVPTLEFDGMLIDIGTNLAYPENVIIEDKNDEEYIETANLLNVLNGVVKYFSNDEIAFEFDVNYEDYTLNGIAYSDTAKNLAKIVLNIGGENLTLFLFDETVFIEFKNVYGKFAIADFDQLNQILKDNFNINLPLEEITSMLTSLKEGKVNEILGGSNISLPSNIDLSIIEEITVVENVTTIVLRGYGTISVKLEDSILSSISYQGFGAFVTVDTTNFVSFELKQEEENYINLAQLLPTLQNAISIFQSRTIVGTVTIKQGGINLPINFLISNEDRLFAKIWTEIKGYPLQINYLDNKIYIDFAGKFKAFVEIDKLTDQLIDFLSGLDVTINTEGIEVIGKAVTEILNSDINPLLIKSLIETENGFVVTMFNDLVLTLCNGENKLNLTTNVESLNLDVEINGSEESTIIPTFDDSDYNSFENVLDLVKAFVNSGLLDVSIGAYNYFKNGLIGLDINTSYQGYEFSSEIYLDIENMKASLSVNYQGENVNFLVIENVVYLEFRNVYAKFALTDVDLIDTLLNDQFGIDLPFEMVEKLLGIVESKDIDEAITQIQEIIGDKVNDFTLDLSVIDLAFFDNITVKGNDTIINLGDNVVTITVANEILTNVNLTGTIDVNLSFVSYQDKQLATEETNYVNLAHLIPTLNNAIEIGLSSTIDGSISVNDMVINYTISKADEVYGAIWTEIEGYKIQMNYYQGKAYLNLADKFKLMSTLENLPTAIETFINEINLEFNTDIDSAQITNALMGIVDNTINPLLIKGLVATDNSFEITLYNDMTITLVNGEKTMTIASSVENYDISIVINGSEKEVVIPEFVEEDYNTVENVLDLVKAFVNSGLLDVSIGAYNYFKNGLIGLNINTSYQGYEFSGEVYLDIENMKASLSVNYQGENVNFLVIDNVVYLEFRNVYAKFALSDIDLIDTLLNDQFGINLPFEMIEKLLGIVESKDIYEAITQIQEIIGDKANDFTLDLSVIDLTFFDNITINGNDTIINLGDNVVTITVDNEILTNVNLTGAIDVNLGFVSYQDTQLATEETNYVNLAHLIPTLNNAIEIGLSNTIDGSISVNDMVINYTISKADEVYAEIWTEIEGYKVEMNYYQGKAYLNFADKFKLMSTLENLPTAIETFINEINLELNTDFDSAQITNALMGIVDKSINPLLIKALVVTDNGFEITLYNDMTITLVNGEKTMTIASSVENYNISIVINGSEKEVVIPEFVEEDYNTVENVLDLVKAFVNSGLLDVSIGAYNYFKNGLIGLDIDTSYQGYEFSGEIYLDIENMKASLSVNYQGENVNFLVIENVVYLEFRNVYAKFALSDIDLIDTLLNDQFGIDLPFEMIEKLLGIVESKDINEAITQIQEIIGDKANDFTLDLSVIDLAFFDNITVKGNDTIINLGDNVVTITVDNEILTNVNLTGSIDVNLGFVSYQDKQLATEETNYVDLAHLIPTLNNAIEIGLSSTIDGSISVNDMVINYTISKTDEVYAEIWTEIEGYKIQMNYYQGKAYLNLADKFKLMSTLENLPTAIETFINEINLEFNTDFDSAQITNALMGIVDKSINPLLIKALVVTDNGFEITLCNDMTITLVNGEKTMTIASSVENYDISIVINGSEKEVVIPEFVEEDYNTVENVLDLVKAFVNSGLLDVSIGAYNYFKNALIGLNISANYNGYEFSGKLYIDIVNLRLYLSAIYDGHTVNFIVEEEIVYIELGNVYLKYALAQANKIDELINTYFGLDYPIEVVGELLNLTKCNDIDSAIAQIRVIADMLSFEMPEISTEDVNVDLSIIDLALFDKISTSGNETTIIIDENNTLTITTIEKMLSKIVYSGLANASVEFVDYDENATFAVDKTKYLDIADAIPTIKNAISILQSPTINGQLTIVDGSQTYPIDFVISRDGDYAEFKTVIYQANLSVQYHAGKVYICFADSVNLISDLETLPEAINTITANTENETNITIEEQNAYIQMIYDLINPELQSMLFTDYTKTENGFIITLFNGVSVTVNNSTNRIDVSTIVNGVAIDGFITGNSTAIVIPTFDDSQYIPIENIFKFVNAIKNMTKETDFHLSGSIDINGNLAGININWNVPFDIKLKIVDGKLEMIASIGPIPTMVGVNNDVPYKADDTGSGNNRILTIYLKDNDIYLYRIEKIPQFFGGGRTYEKCTKTSVEGFFADPMYYLQYGLGFTDTIMAEIGSAIEKSKNRENPINLNNVIKLFQVDATGNNLTIILNMQEIANNDLLENMTLKIALGKNTAGEDVIANMGLNFFMPLASVFELTLDSNDIHFVDYGYEIDLNNLYEYVNNYKYKFDEEWEASNGNWEKVSSVLYTINFEENGGAETPNISQIYNSTIMLPTLSAIIIDDGTTLTTKTFDGWYTTSTFEEGTLFTSTTMPRKDFTLYAKWKVEIKYYRTISFITNSEFVVENVKGVEGNSVILPSLSVKQVTEGHTTTFYTFDGWYFDVELTKAFTNYIMPNEDTVLYAKWLVADVETARLFQIYDNNDVIFTRYILAGEKIDLSGVGEYIDGQTQLYHDSGYATIYDGSFTMPDSELTLYVRNKYTFVLNTNKSGVEVELQRYSLWQNETFTLPTTSNFYTDDGTQTARVYYTFTGYSVNGAEGSLPTVMTNYDLTLCELWTTETKLYYTVDFDLRWYLVLGCTEGSEMKTQPTPIDSIKVLDGTTVDLTPYQPTCMAYKTAVKSVFGKDQAKPFKATTWGASAWANYTKGGKGVTSITITGNTTLYACWKQQ